MSYGATLTQTCKAFVHGRKIPHDGVKTRKRSSREEVENRLREAVREALELQVADLRLQLSLKDRDLKDCHSIIRRLAEELNVHSAIYETTLLDMKGLKPEVFTEQKLAAFAIPPPVFNFNSNTGQ